MKKYQRFAPLGLYLAILAALVSAGLYFVRREFDLYQQISIGLIVVGLAVYALLAPDKVRQAITGRQARYGSNAFVLLLASIGILVVVNFMIYQDPPRWDLTEDKANTLAPETIEILDSLEESVTIQGFFADSVPTSTDELLQNYELFSDGKISYEYINPVMDPVAAQEAEIAQDRTLVLYMGERREAITSATEKEISAALLRLLSGDERVVYFLTGHGEYSPDDTGDESYSLARRTMDAKNYRIELLNLIGGEDIPADADVVVVAGPQVPVTADEVAKLKAFSTAGGALVVMEEPTIFTQFGDAEDSLAAYLAEDWGITLGNDLILDRTSSVGAFPFATEVSQHVITNTISNNVFPFFPTARSVTISNPLSNLGQSELLLTAPFDATWAETDLDSLLAQEEPTADEATDLPGPVPVMVVAEDTFTGARLVVVGDSDFAADAYFQRQSNGQLFLATMDWVTEQDALINLTTETPTQRFIVPPSTTTVYLLYLFAICLLPAGLLAIGGVVWYLRRKRG
ncbi:MAG: GldG family protein [Anaerolineales bacterium]|nr:GldG family protein [Anaerolineales bacterium]